MGLNMCSSQVDNQPQDIVDSADIEVRIHNYMQLCKNVILSCPHVLCAASQKKMQITT